MEIIKDDLRDDTKAYFNYAKIIDGAFIVLFTPTYDKKVADNGTIWLYGCKRCSLHINEHYFANRFIEVVGNTIRVLNINISPNTGVESFEIRLLK